MVPSLNKGCSPLRTESWSIKESCRRGSIIRITGFLANLNFPDRVIFVVTDLDILMEKCDLIGNPVPIPINACRRVNVEAEDEEEDKEDEKVEVEEVEDAEEGASRYLHV